LPFPTNIETANDKTAEAAMLKKVLTIALIWPSPCAVAELNEGFLQMKTKFQHRNTETPLMPTLTQYSHKNNVPY
jgi:hypothetical protein